MRRVLVTGVRGKTGVPLARSLAGRPDVEVRGGSSDPTTVTLDGVVPTAFSWDDPATWVAAADDVDAVYVVRPDRPDAPDLVAALLDVLPAAARVVLLSERAADYPDHDHWALRSEDAVRRSGRRWTILRPSWFMQVLTDPRFYLDEIRAGRLPYPSAGADVAWIDARDIAAVAERALLDDDLDTRVLEITGPAALSLPQTAALLSVEVGRPVVHDDVTPAEAATGTEGFERDLTLLTFDRVRAGTFAVVTDTVAEVTGRPARSMADFLADEGSVLRATV